MPMAEGPRSMVAFPVIRSFLVDNYRLFPGIDGENSLSFSPPEGISIVAGVNGLGKTTLINILFRLIVGPFDIPKLDEGSRFGSTARDRDTGWIGRRDFFTRRVADRAATASAELHFSIGDTPFVVRRSLADCRLISAVVSGRQLDISTQTEADYKTAILNASGFSSYVDFLIAVKFLTFFNEERRDILWDNQAQRQFFRILFASAANSQDWVRLESEIGSADSSARNASAYAVRLEREIISLEEALQKNAGVAAELAAKQRILDADLAKLKDLEGKAEALGDSIANLSRQTERAKLAEDDARRLLEELRYTALGRLFPTLDETSRYILTHLFANGRCLACGAEAEAEVERLTRAIRDGICAVCGSAANQHDHGQADERVVPSRSLERRKIKKAEESLSTIRIEREASTAAEMIARDQLKSITGEIDRLMRAIDNQRLANATLRARLPPDPQEIADKRRAFEAARTSQKESERQRATAERRYQVLLSQTEEIFRAASTQIARRFQRYATAFLEEECSLSFRLVEDRPSQSGARFMYPSLKFEMSAAAFETRQFREHPEDVSESQREFVDLAFRMALMEAASIDERHTLVIETPEASLDAIFMRKAGHMLRAFAENGTRIIVTSNLTSSVMIPALLGGETDNADEILRRRNRILSLLDVAAPNAAVRKFGEEYRQFLETGIRGRIG